MVKKTFFFMVCIICVFCMVSCSINNKQNVDADMLKSVGKYFALVFKQEFNQAYEMIHPDYIENISFEDYVKTIEAGENEHGKMSSLKISDRIDRIDDSIFKVDVVLATPKRYVIQNIEMIKIDNTWYLGEVKPLGYTDRNN